MMTFRGLAWAALLIGLAAPALAEPATPEEGRRLTALFQTYLGATPGVVTVTPMGDAYEARFDLAPLLATIPAPELTVVLSPQVMRLTDQGNGKWLVTQDQPVGFSMSVPGQVDMAVTIGALTSNGVFDERLAAFSSSVTNLAEMSIDQTQVQPDGTKMMVAYRVGAMHYESTARAGAAGGVDGEYSYTITDLAEDVRMSASAGMPMPMDFSFTADEVISDESYAGLRTAPIYALIAWFVAHPGEAAIKGGQAEMKGLLAEVLPVFQSLAGTSTVKNLQVVTAMGAVGIAELGIVVAASGVVEDGLLHQRISMEGLTLPAGLVPDWAVDLVPQKAAFDLTVTGFNLADPAGIILGAMDLAAADPVPPSLNPRLLAALLPNGTVTLSTEATGATSGIYDVVMSGSMVAGPDGMPSGSGLITASGMDAVIEALQADPETSASVMPVLVVAKGMARTEADGRLSWAIELTRAGTVLVNGVDASAMGGP